MNNTDICEQSFIKVVGMNDEAGGLEVLIYFLITFFVVSLSACTVADMTLHTYLAVKFVRLQT